MPTFYPLYGHLEMLHWYILHNNFNLSNSWKSQLCWAWFLALKFWLPLFCFKFYSKGIEEASVLTSFLNFPTNNNDRNQLLWIIYENNKRFPKIHYIISNPNYCKSQQIRGRALGSIGPYLINYKQVLKNTLPNFKPL